MDCSVVAFHQIWGFWKIKTGWILKAFIPGCRANRLVKMVCNIL